MLPAVRRCRTSETILRSGDTRGVEDGTLFGEADAEAAPTLTVAELSSRVARVTASAFPSELWVSGQIRNLNRSSAGHVYFDLAEPSPAGTAPRVQISVTLLAPERQVVNRQLTAVAGSVRIEDGVEVRILGRVRWYAPRGVLQFRMHGIDPAFTLGRLQADRERTLARLREDGLLDANSRLPLPEVPLTVGLVTSHRSAAFADVIHELEASGYGFRVRFVDARTQGMDCGASVVRALRRLASDGPDVVLLVRGGGARTDLAGFDGEDIARAIATMPVPVFTGIGHEVDRSIADEVAHTSHKTPTAAAAALVAAVGTFLDRLDRCWGSLLGRATGAADVAEARLAQRTERLCAAARRDLRAQSGAADDRVRRVSRAADHALRRADDSLTATGKAVSRASLFGIGRCTDAVDLLAARIAVHDPAHLLARGWSITTTSDGRPVDVATLRAGDTIHTRLASATLSSTVDAVTVTPLGSRDAGTDQHPGTNEVERRP